MKRPAVFETAGDYLAKRARELGLSRGHDLQRIQAWLDDHYGGQVRAISLNHGVLKLVTPSAALASDLRLGQVELLRQVKTNSQIVQKVVITIR